MLLQPDAYHELELQKYVGKVLLLSNWIRLTELLIADYKDFKVAAWSSG